MINERGKYKEQSYRDMGKLQITHPIRKGSNENYYKKSDYSVSSDCLQAWEVDENSKES